jgi:hypothetical protein
MCNFRPSVLEALKFTEMRCNFIFKLLLLSYMHWNHVLTCGTFYMIARHKEVPLRSIKLCVQEGMDYIELCTVTAGFHSSSVSDHRA